MAKYEVVGNLLAIFTVDDETGVVERVHICDGGPSFEHYMDVWRLGPNYETDKSDISNVGSLDRDRIRNLVGSEDHPGGLLPFGFPPFGEWES